MIGICADRLCEPDLTNIFVDPVDVAEYPSFMKYVPDEAITDWTNPFLNLLTKRHQGFVVRTGSTNEYPVVIYTSNDFPVRWLVSDTAVYSDPLRESAKATLKHLYSQSAIDAKILSDLFGQIENAFSEQNLNYVDSILSEFDPSRVKRIVSIGLLRSTFRAREKLPSWRSCLVKVYEMLNNQQQDTKKILRGLINSDDRIAFTSTQTIF